MRHVRYTHVAVLLVLICIYVAVRFWRISDTCLWFDEIYSVHAAEHPWNEVLGFVALDLIHPPLFYLLLKVWIGIGGEGVVWLRSLSVVLSVIAIFPIVRICWELGLS